MRLDFGQKFNRSVILTSNIAAPFHSVDEAINFTDAFRSTQVLHKSSDNVTETISA